MKTYVVNEQLLRRWFQNSKDIAIAQEMSDVLAGAAMPTSNDVIVNSKRNAMSLLKQVKNNETLDTELLQLVVRGYIGALDLILALGR